jgi:opacity protein-like surface antigen
MNGHPKPAATSLAVALLIVPLQMQAAQANSEQRDSASQLGKASISDYLFEYGRYEIALNNGVLFSPFVATGGRPHINYTVTELQFGCMLSDVKHAGWLSGNLELLGAGAGGTVFTGAGNYVAGGTAWLRYNFVQEKQKLVPYAQLGAGISFTDLDRRVLGQNFNFNLNLGVGVRYLLAPNWSVSLEYRYQHISNADMAKKNIGINADGPMLGVAYLF